MFTAGCSWSRHIYGCVGLGVEGGCGHRVIMAAQLDTHGAYLILGADALVYTRTSADEVDPVCESIRTPLHKQSLEYSCACRWLGSFEIQADG